MKSIAIKLRKKTEIIFCRPAKKEILLQPNDWVIIKTNQGEEVGWIEFEQSKTSSQTEAEILRKANQNDLEKLKKIQQEEKRASQIFKNKVTKHRLSMKLVQIILSFDERRLTFYFSAETRVDFRDLVKDLVNTFKKLIRLQQIGPRDEAKMRGGFGRCGRPLCCQTFLNKIESITMERAREQKLTTISASKISGLCGKLMCCLSFEEKLYEELRKKLPKIGTKVQTPLGNKGVVIDHNVLLGTVLVELSDGTKTEVKVGDKNV